MEYHPAIKSMAYMRTKITQTSIFTESGHRELRKFQYLVILTIGIEISIRHRKYEFIKMVGLIWALDMHF